MWLVGVWRWDGVNRQQSVLHAITGGVSAFASVFVYSAIEPLAGWIFVVIWPFVVYVTAATTVVETTNGGETA